MALKVPAQAEKLNERDGLLEKVQQRVLWLSVNMVHHANRVREHADDLKVGGHQASSASVVTVMTSLYFDFMRAGDRISVKPHASPVFHAIQYLLGNLEPHYLKTLRQFHGLQAYPSRTKDPDSVDFSTGSVGLGAVAPNFARLVEDYVRTHTGAPDGSARRYISLVGDAELDEGSVWEAIAEPAMYGLNHLLWVVDLNRQSLDRIIPGIRVKAWRQMFAANGWNVVDVKYGKRLQAAYAMPHGELLRDCIDEMSNELYQRLLRVSPQALREWLPRASAQPKDLARFLGQWSDEELQHLFRNLGGHDFAMLREAFAQTEQYDGPSVVFAYTLKGWNLPSVGDPQNHSVLLSDQQMEQLRAELGISAESVWASLEAASPEGKLCAGVKERLREPPKQTAVKAETPVPTGFGRSYQGKMSTQQIFGLILTEIARNIPETAERVVTVSPDVASSTNLGGWINKVGVWTRRVVPPMPEEGIQRALNWEEIPGGRHIELGISENNLFMMLGQLGLTHEMLGEVLLPIGTLYDPFVRRGLDALYYSVYSGGKFIFVGTPSGVSLGPEGGAHQSEITPSIGLELPEVSYYEPCFGQELEWIVLSALEQIRQRKESTYLRLSTKKIDQSLFRRPDGPQAEEALRRQVLAGAYRLVDRSGTPGYAPGENAVHIFACGAMVPEAVEAARRLEEEGVLANVIAVPGPGPLYRWFQESVRGVMHPSTGSGQALRPRTAPFLADVVPLGERKAPVVTVLDGHPHMLAWLGGALNTKVFPLGVTRFGQSGSQPDLYKEYGIDVSSIMAACFGALEN